MAQKTGTTRVFLRGSMIGMICRLKVLRLLNMIGQKLSHKKDTGKAK